LPAQRRLIVLALVGALLAWPAEASGQTDPYASDPLGLIAWRSATNTYSSGTDTWQVWVCDTPAGPISLNPQSVTTTLNSQVSPYFTWLSGGMYTPSFSAGGTVTVSNPGMWPQDPLTAGQCEQAVVAATTGSPKGAVIVIDSDYGGGYGTNGLVCFTGSCGFTSRWPSNMRRIVVGAATVTATPGSTTPELLAVAHEIGHGLAWPHSFGGATVVGGSVYEYDNPMDVMSGGSHVDLDIGTIAINRYAAGWLPATSVGFHRKGDSTYAIDAATGRQLLILPTDTPGLFNTISARTIRGYDTGLPKEGIEVYLVDQRPNACAVPSPVGNVCYGINRHHDAEPEVAGLESIAHVFGVGEVTMVRGVRVEVVARSGTRFTVRVTGSAVSERFIDDNDSPHEADIEAIALAGITAGCNVTTDRFCPRAAVTRAEMATFLLAALKEKPLTVYRGYFTDVPAGQWYTGMVERAYELGLTAGTGQRRFSPGAAVTRAEMATFLHRALGLAAVPPGSYFGDVPSGAWFAPFVESIRRRGITAGCAAGPPPLFCPSQPVLREQMATFLARGFLP
jgi:hypothetical protein